MKLDHNSSVPLHLQAENMLRELIRNEDYQRGKLLPNEVELSEQLHISRNTLRQAINKLVYEGLLVRKKGVGTRVVKKGIVSGANNWLSFSQEMKMLGVTVRNFELHLSHKTPGEEVERFFNMEPTGTGRFFTLERVRGNQDYPFVYFISYFNPAIALSGDEDFVAPLYEMLEQRFGIVVKTSREEISARLAGDFIAEKLDIDSTDPILVRKRMVYDVNNVPVEFNIGFYRADSFTYSIDSTR